MRRIKALWFCLSLAGAIHIAAAAQAAELSALPPAPPLDEPELRGSLTEDSGFYARLDAGLANEAEKPVSLGDPAILGVGAGYQASAWLRADVTGEYRPGVNYRANSPPQIAGALKTGLFLANAYVDFGDWGGFTPYVGAGLGAAVWQTSAIHPLFHGDAFGFAHEASGTGFAWDLTAGVAYRLSPNLLIDLNYRYVNMGSVRTAAIVCNGLPSCHWDSRSFNIASNDLRIGLRWMAIEPPVAPEAGARY